jgi:hypothetical protein
MAPMLAHIAGVPVEETVLMVVPIFGLAFAAIAANLRAHRRRLFKRK